MDSRQNAPPCDFVFWSYAPPLVVDSATIWSESLGHAQPALDSGLGDPTPDIGWDSVATLQNPSQDGGTPTGVEAASAVAFNTEFNYSDNRPVNFNDINLDFPDPWLMAASTLTDSLGASTSSSPSDAVSWSLHSQSPTSMGVARQEAPVSGGSSAPITVSPDQLAWIFDLGQFYSASLSYTPVDRSGLGEMVPYFSTNFVDLNGPPVEPMFPTGWRPGSPRLPIPRAAPGPVPGVVTLPQMNVRKRQQREEDILHGQKTSDGHRPSLPKRCKCKTTMAARTGILGAGGSGSGTPQMLATRNHLGIHRKSKTLGCGAESPATLIVQGVSDRFPHGPSVQQGLTGAISQEQMPWVEGSAEGVTGYHINSTTQEDKMVDNVGVSEPEEAKSNVLFYIPRGLDARHRALLDATSDDWVRGAVRVLKCRLCPGAGFSNWEIFRRHCNAMEAHPDKISFCKYCGDFFARHDSLTRHYDSRPQECRNVSSAKAEIKRRETERVHAECEERLERCLKTKEDIGKPFARIIKEMDPESSKRGSRQQNHLKESRSRR